jgi:energy-coupling factor transporter transmembrane protein EcfT
LVVLIVIPGLVVLIVIPALVVLIAIPGLVVLIVIPGLVVLIVIPGLVVLVVVPVFIPWILIHVHLFVFEVLDCRWDWRKVEDDGVVVDILRVFFEETNNLCFKSNNVFLVSEAEQKVGK